MCNKMVANMKLQSLKAIRALVVQLETWFPIQVFTYGLGVKFFLVLKTIQCCKIFQFVAFGCLLRAIYCQPEKVGDVALLGILNSYNFNCKHHYSNSTCQTIPRRS
jgi:hypothetical protein